MSSGGHKTSAIPRPAQERDDSTSSGRAATGVLDRRDDTLLSDFTRPIDQSKRLVRGRGKRGVMLLLAAVVTAAFGAALFVLPVKAWLRQQGDIDRKQQELNALDQANAELGDDINRLNTPAGIEEAAREEIGYVQRGEIRLTVLPAPDAPVTMPSGWPYDALAQILTVRQAVAAAPTSTP
ncbi:MAG: FtsB family cell division protein [Ilumatobacteraceae bacterium]